MSFLCITNNYSFYEKYKNDFKILLNNTGFREILIITRNMVHLGHKLLSHPLSGSVKPNETMVKTIFVSDKQYRLDFNSLSLIENSIITFDKFTKKTVEQVACTNNRADYECIDSALAESALLSLFVLYK